jgi:hypothetical protein
MKKEQLINEIIKLKPHLLVENLAMLSREHLEEILAEAKR